jgi:hypothetical protein
LIANAERLAELIFFAVSREEKNQSLAIFGKSASEEATIKS